MHVDEWKNPEVSSRPSGDLLAFQDELATLKDQLEASGRVFVIGLVATPANPRAHAVALNGKIAQQLTQSTDSTQPVGRFLSATFAVFTPIAVRHR